MLLLLPYAHAGDLALYDRTIDLVEQHYLRASEIDPEAMFASAGRVLEDEVDWLMVEPGPRALTLADGGGSWTTTVRLEDADGLAPALSRLEDAVRAAGRPLDPDLDLRVLILEGAVKTLDRHSVILHARGLERFDERLTGLLSGVGATITAREDGLEVTALVADGPALRAGLRVGDRLLRIDGTATVGMTPNDATRRIRGVAGTEVTLLVRRADGTEHDVTIRREEIHIRNVHADTAENGVAVVTIDHFSEQTRTWLDRTLADLAGSGALARGLVIDLRGNTGGSLIQSAQAADAFLTAGTIVTTVGRDAQPVPSLVQRLEAHPDAPVLDMPLAVLMDARTASGSEILAGALAGLDRAILVGERSFGKGTVQKVYQIDPDIKLKLTVAEYLVEGEQRVADVGLTPDVAVERVRILDGQTVLPDPIRGRERIANGVPIVTQLDTDGRDAALALAARLVAGGSGSARAALLASADDVARQVASEEDQRVRAAFADAGIDWSPAPDGAVAPPDVRVELLPGASVTAGRDGFVDLRVTNLGPPIWRAAVRLASANPVWDARVAPIGHLAADAVVTVRLPVTPAATAAARTDDVGFLLETDGAAGVPAGAARLRVTAGPPLEVGVTARALETDGVARIELALRNRGRARIEGLEARFDFPDVDGLELVDTASPALGVPSRGTGTTALSVAVSDAFQGTSLPLDLVLETAEGRSLRVPLDVPRDGRALRREPPRLEAVVDGGDVLPTGRATLRVRAADDHRLDHVTVFAGPERLEARRSGTVRHHDRDKIAWRAVRARAFVTALEVPVALGVNRYTVIAEDDDGLRTVVDVHVLGTDAGAEDQ